ncbi:MAG: hypothetical protein J6L89_05315 [Clostridia bacterium]|nr:hypothetical protein [Clostridia bacterium]
MKKFLAMLMAAAMLLSFAACKSDKEEETTTAAETTVAETTTSPLQIADQRLSLPASINVWTKGKKVSYKKDETKVGTATAAVNDSRGKGDIFSASKKKVTAETIEDIKKNNSCIEYIYDKEQKNAFVGKGVAYDKVVIATTGEYANIITFIKGKEVVGSVLVEKGEINEKPLAERLLSAVEIVKHEHKD